MSLTSALLLGEKIELPKGRRVMHRMGGQPDKCSESQCDERAANIERVHAAIVAGAKTRIECIDATGLSNRTVWAATIELAEWPGGPRIVIEKVGNKHFLYDIGLLKTKGQQ